MVGDGDAVGVTAEILEHILGAPEGWFGVDHPVFAKQRSQPGGEESGLRERRQIPGKVSELIRYQLQEHDGGWHLQFDFDSAALPQLLNQRLGRTVLLTNRMDWSAEHIVAGYSGQQQIERVLRGLKQGDWLGWDPMYHWTDRKIRIHAFYCLLGISLLQFVHKQAQAAWADLSMEQLIEELQRIQQFVLLYPRQGEKGFPRAAYVLNPS